MRVITLGRLGLEGHSLRRPKPLLLLAYLALEGPQTRRFLRDLFFFDAADAADALTTTVRRLREAQLVFESEGALHAAVECDAAELLSLLDAGAVAEATRRYGGPFLAGVNLRLGTEAEEWVYSTREFLVSRLRAALLRAADGALSVGQHERARQLAETAVSVAGADDHNPEELISLLRHLRASNSVAAERVRQAAASLGVLHDTNDASQQQVTGPMPNSYRPFPTPHSVLLGRADELARAVELLTSGSCRLLNLHGPAGVGKTRLAIEVAAHLKEQAKTSLGTLFVATDALVSTEQLPAAIADQLGISLVGADSRLELYRAIGEQPFLLVLDSVEHLLHAASEGGESFAAFVQELLSICPQVALLVTSRERLAVPAEWVLPVSGLKVGGSTDANVAMATNPAEQLFERRAQAANGSFALSDQDRPVVSRICRAVDGFPLGIELAAAWTRVLTLGQLAKSLESNLAELGKEPLNLGTRHPSLWATLDHSWKLLSDWQQRVFAKLAVFRGGFRREAAAYVANASIADLMSLSDKSLLRMEPDGRFSLHTLLWQYGLEKLGELGGKAENAARERHAEFFARLLQDSRVGDASGSSFGLLRDDEPNLLQSLEWAAASGRAELVVAQSEPLLWYFAMTARFGIGNSVFAAAHSALARQPEDDSLQPSKLAEATAALLLCRAWINRYAGSVTEAAALAEEGEKQARLAGSQLQLVTALDLRGQALTYSGWFEKAISVLVEGEQTAEELADQARLSRMRSNLAIAQALAGDTRAASHKLQAAMRPFEDGELPLGLDTVAVHLALGVNAWCRGRPEEAVLPFTSGIELARQLNYSGPLPVMCALLVRSQLASVSSDAGQPATSDPDLLDQAEQLIGLANQILASSNEAMGRSLLLGAAAALALRRENAQAALSLAQEAEKVAKSVGNAVVMLWSVPQLVAAFRQLGQQESAEAVAKAALSHRACPPWLASHLASYYPAARDPATS